MSGRYIALLLCLLAMAAAEIKDKKRVKKFSLASARKEGYELSDHEMIVDGLMNLLYLASEDPSAPDYYDEAKLLAKLKLVDNPHVPDMLKAIRGNKELPEKVNGKHKFTRISYAMSKFADPLGFDAQVHDETAKRHELFEKIADRLDPEWRKRSKDGSDLHHKEL
ncbi:uncharacterized protein LOC108677867 [Hyalella azteca]|uniref:Uncharacterized protein LOC108677867 n=1 Tax=Hyalella azteca TaxID=294128 RepID=A0A8B7P679_HYAAZ|nr:uncharacterized protein LOC108677867 [Hyalella azteca]